jgi:Tol biopolymer transport system component
MILMILTWVMALSSVSAPIIQACTGAGLQPRPADFAQTGIILTTWSRETMWAYDLARDVRYPIPDTTPCGTNCHLTPDSLSITYHDNNQGGIGLMWLNGGNRRVLLQGATEVEWWNDNRLLVWSSSNKPYLVDVGGTERETIERKGLISLQPNGYWGITLTLGDDGEFQTQLINVQDETQIIALGVDEAYYNAHHWSPDGRYLAIVRRESRHDTAYRRGAELYFIEPDQSLEPVRVTNFTDEYGAVRIGGLSPRGLSWSPDGEKVAFWVMVRTGNQPEDLAPAQLHIFDLKTGSITAYCDYETTRHTPNPPRLVWSPDGEWIAFGGEDTIRGGISTGLIALNVTEGGFYRLTTDMVATMNNNPDVIAWGHRP